MGESLGESLFEGLITGLLLFAWWCITKMYQYMKSKVSQLAKKKQH